MRPVPLCPLGRNQPPQTLPPREELPRGAPPRTPQPSGQLLGPGVCPDFLLPQKEVGAALAAPAL